MRYRGSLLCIPYKFGELLRRAVLEGSAPTSTTASTHLCTHRFDNAEIRVAYKVAVVFEGGKVSIF